MIRLIISIFVVLVNPEDALVTLPLQSIRLCSESEIQMQIFGHRHLLSFSIHSHSAKVNSFGRLPFPVPLTIILFLGDFPVLFSDLQ